MIFIGGIASGVVFSLESALLPDRNEDLYHSFEESGGMDWIYEELDIRSLEEQIGYSLTDRTELCNVIRLAGYVALGITAMLIALLLLCHLFRPSGFFTAGAFSLVTGGFMLLGARSVQKFLKSVFYSELSLELAADEIPEFFLTMVESILGWCLTGFEKVGKIGLMTAVVLILVGILLYVIKQNQAEPVSVYEMQ